MIDELVLVPGILGLLVVTGVAALIDMLGHVRARRASTGRIAGSNCENFHVLVPIYGSIRYLENVTYLATYGERVVLCTTTNETPSFYADLLRIARSHGFAVFYGVVGGGPTAAGRRQTAGTTRDRLVRDALDDPHPPVRRVHRR